jgi:hypothetical protein
MAIFSFHVTVNLFTPKSVTVREFPTGEAARDGLTTLALSNGLIPSGGKPGAWYVTGNGIPLPLAMPSCLGR